MGLNASAELIWGIPVVSHDEDGEPTVFWSEEDSDWRNFDGELVLRPYGHYEDPDAERAILTSTRVEHYGGDCWDPTEVPDRLAVSDEVREACNAAGLDVDFYNARWCLVANFG